MLSKAAIAHSSDPFSHLYELHHYYMDLKGCLALV